MVTNESASSLGVYKDMEKMMKQLGNREEDLDDLVYEDVLHEPTTVTRWLAIGRVYMSREYVDF